MTEYMWTVRPTCGRLIGLHLTCDGARVHAQPLHGNAASDDRCGFMLSLRQGNMRTAGYAPATRMATRGTLCFAVRPRDGSRRDHRRRGEYEGHSHGCARHFHSLARSSLVGLTFSIAVLPVLACGWRTHAGFNRAHQNFVHPMVSCDLRASSVCFTTPRTGFKRFFVF